MVRTLSDYILARCCRHRCGRAHEGAVLVGKRDAQAVDLKLAGIGNTTSTERILGALEPCVELRPHPWHRPWNTCVPWRDRRKLLAHVAAHTLGIAVGRYQIGVGRLDFLQLNEHFVKGGIRASSGASSM